MYNGRRVFRAGTVQRVLPGIAAAIFAAVAYAAYRTQGWNWVAIGMVVAVVFGIVGIVESVLVRIELTDDALLLTDLRGTRRIPKADITRIEESKGGPPAVQLTSGVWIKLPSVAQAVGNSVRAWLRQ